MGKHLETSGISMSKCVLWLAKREQGLCRSAPAFPVSLEQCVPCSCFFLLLTPAEVSVPAASLLRAGPPAQLQLPSLSMVGHGTVSPVTLCPKTTAEPVSSSGSYRCLLPSACPELHRMRGAPSPGTSGSTCPCAPWEMHQTLVFIALTPMAP